MTWREYPGARVMAGIVAAARSINPGFATENRGAIPNGGLLPLGAAS